MRADHLQARSIAFVEAAIIAGFAYVLALLAFARLWGLMVSEEWLAPLVVMMGVQFVAGVILANHRGLLNWNTIRAELAIKGLIVLAYVAGFSIQRMYDSGKDGSEGLIESFGHAVAGALVGFEFLRFVRILRSFGLKLGPFEAALIWFDKTFAAEVRKQDTETVAVQAAKAERRAAREEYWSTGEVGSQPVITALSDEMKAVADSDPEIDATLKDGTGGV